MKLLLLIPILLLIPLCSYAQPQVLTVNYNSTNSTIGLSWNPITNASLYGYAVRISSTTYFNAWIPGTSVIISPVTPDTNYNIEVITKYINGTYGYDSNTIATTQPNTIHITNNTGWYSYPLNRKGISTVSLPPLDLGSEAQWKIPNNNNHVRCFTYTGLSNHTLDSIYGSLSSVSTGIDKKTWSQLVLSIWLSPDVIQSNAGGQSGASSSCMLQNGTKFTDDSKLYLDGGFKIASLIQKLSSSNSTSYSVQFEHMNQTIPNRYNLNIVYAASSNSGPPNGWMDIEMQAMAFLKK